MFGNLGAHRKCRHECGKFHENEPRNSVFLTKDDFNDSDSDITKPSSCTEGFVSW